MSSRGTEEVREAAEKLGLKYLGEEQGRHLSLYFENKFGFRFRTNFHTGSFGNPNEAKAAIRRLKKFAIGQYEGLRVVAPEKSVA